MNNFHLKYKGFSLVELLITLSIFIVVLSIGVPSMSDFFRTARLSSDADSFVGFVNLARLEAIRSKNDAVVCALSNPQSDVTCSADVADWSKGWGVISNGIVLRRFVPGSEITVASASAAVTFTGTIGGATAATSLTLCAKGLKQQQVSIRVSGSVTKFVNSSIVCS